MGSTTPDDFFTGSPAGLAVYRRVNDLITRARSDVTVRVSKSQVAFRCRRGFAYIWRPGQYLRRPEADVVLSIALHRQVSSERFKEVAHPAPTVWMHHLEIQSVDDVDHEVEVWLLEAADDAEAVRIPPARRDVEAESVYTLKRNSTVDCITVQRHMGARPMM